MESIGVVIRISPTAVIPFAKIVAERSAVGFRAERADNDRGAFVHVCMTSQSTYADFHKNG